MTKDDLKKMLNTVYEMEGLIELALHRDMLHSDSIRQLIADKSYLMADMAAQWREVNDNLLSDSIEHKETEIDETENDDTAELETPESENDRYKEYMPKTESCVETGDEITAEDESESKYDEEKTEIVADVVDEQNCGNIEETEGEEIITDDESAIELQYDVVEVQRHGDIKNLFTINDTFRFCRELFGNSKLEFKESLNLVQAMSAYEEAEDYFYNDLQWDSENEDVVEFMAIIVRYFKG